MLLGQRFWLKGLVMNTLRSSKYSCRERWKNASNLGINSASEKPWGQLESTILTIGPIVMENLVSVGLRGD